MDRLKLYDHRIAQSIRIEPKKTTKHSRSFRLKKAPRSLLPEPLLVNMRITIAVVSAFVATVAVASPITSPSTPLSRRQGPPGPGGPMGVGAGVAGVGACPVSCLLNLD